MLACHVLHALASWRFVATRLPQPLALTTYTIDAILKRKHLLNRIRNILVVRVVTSRSRSESRFRQRASPWSEQDPRRSHQTLSQLDTLISRSSGSIAPFICHKEPFLQESNYRSAQPQQEVCFAGWQSRVVAVCTSRWTQKKRLMRQQVSYLMLAQRSFSWSTFPENPIVPLFLLRFLEPYFPSTSL